MVRFESVLKILLYIHDHGDRGVWFNMISKDCKIAKTTLKPTLDFMEKVGLILECDNHNKKEYVLKNKGIEFIDLFV